MELNEQQLNGSLRKSYRLRMAIPGSKTVEVTFPFEVVEREARKRGLSIKDFLKLYHAIAHYDNFDGVFYSFEERANATETDNQRSLD